MCSRSGSAWCSCRAAEVESPVKKPPAHPPNSVTPSRAATLSHSKLFRLGWSPWGGSEALSWRTAGTNRQAVGRVGDTLHVSWHLCTAHLGQLPSLGTCSPPPGHPNYQQGRSADTHTGGAAQSRNLESPGRVSKDMASDAECRGTLQHSSDFVNEFRCILTISLFKGNFLKAGDWAGQPTPSATPFNMGLFISLEILEKNFPLYHPPHPTPPTYNQNLSFPYQNWLHLYFLVLNTQNCFCTMESKPLKQCTLAFWASMTSNQFVT